MMRPARCRIIGFSTACVSENAAVRLVAITASQSSRFIRSIKPSLVIPALFTRMSSRPCRSNAPVTSASFDAASATSTVATSAFPPAFVISSTVAAAFCSRAAATTVAPCAASLVAIARPIPLDAPVTSATFPVRLIIASTPLRGPLRLPRSPR